LILYHILLFGADEESILNEVREKYDGKVILANDLDVFE
jgi:ribonuclease BN (tRNA processing enzyme)